MYLEELIENVELESDKFECKSRLNREDVVGWLKSIAGFANASGGDFYIGVEDKTNKLIGFDRTEADNERNYFNNQVNEHLSPRPQMKLSFLRYMIKEKERFIIQVHIPESAVKPVILKYKNIPSIFMRRDGFTNGATYEEIIEMSVRSKNTQYDILTSDELYRAENFTMLQEFYASHNNGRNYQRKHCSRWDSMIRTECLQMVQYFLQMIIREKRRRCSVLSFPVLIKAVNVSLLLIVSMEISLRCSII